MPQELGPGPRGRADLRDDCARCVGLCCVLLAFARSSDFALDKPAGRPCPNLAPDARCTIHSELRRHGFRGCATYSCFGAGPRVHLVTFGGADWRDQPGTLARMQAAFPVVRALHELVWYLSEAAAAPLPAGLRSRVRATLERLEASAALGPDALAAFDLGAERATANDVLLEVSQQLRSSPRPGPDHRGADLVGARLHGADLRRACLRGALMMGADLRSADLRDADVTGADLRDADLSGADLRGIHFLTQMQLRSASGSARTRLPEGAAPPDHWAD